MLATFLFFSQLADAVNSLATKFHTLESDLVAAARPPADRIDTAESHTQIIEVGARHDPEAVVDEDDSLPPQAPANAMFAGMPLPPHASTGSATALMNSTSTAMALPFGLQHFNMQGPPQGT